MKIFDIISFIELLAPPDLQENYDNSGLLAGEPQQCCTGVVCSLDLTEAVIDECIVSGSNLIVVHHPILFKPIKSLIPSTYPARCLIKAIKNDINIYAVHTNYDNVFRGVNLAFAQKIGLNRSSLRIMSPLEGKLIKLQTYVPVSHTEIVRNGLFEAGAGHIGNYKECSFSSAGTGTFKPMEGTNPYIGTSGGNRENVEEQKIEVIFPAWLKIKVLASLRHYHPYEEIAFDLTLTDNTLEHAGAGMIGELNEALDEKAFLRHIIQSLGIKLIRHSPPLDRKIKTVAICGGAGAFLIKNAMDNKVDAYLTGDLKYHDYFDPDGKMLLLDVGHFESEIHSIAQLTNYLKEKFPTFAILQSKIDTNPVYYFTD